VEKLHFDAEFPAASLLLSRLVLSMDSIVTRFP
jgi:hypothetical protein